MTKSAWTRAIRPPRLTMKRLAQLAILLALLSPAASSQCVMCYQSASGASSQGQKVLTRAVIVLLLPPVTCMGVLLTIALKHRGPFAD
jgi:hypothetical protein